MLSIQKVSLLLRIMLSVTTSSQLSVWLAVFGMMSATPNHFGVSQALRWKIVLPVNSSLESSSVKKDNLKRKTIICWTKSNVCYWLAIRIINVILRYVELLMSIAIVFIQPPCKFHLHSSVWFARELYVVGELTDSSRIYGTFSRIDHTLWRFGLLKSCCGTWQVLLLLWRRRCTGRLLFRACFFRWCNEFSDCVGSFVINLHKCARNFAFDMHLKTKPSVEKPAVVLYTVHRYIRQRCIVWVTAWSQDSV